MNKHFILATAGHVDHGKSSLVKALTGIDPDRLPEEKARGITIELGFAYLDLVASTDPEVRFRVGIVDVPGHEDFVKNMVAGVGPINVALLVVAADDGWMPQTEEHLQILIYLGVSRLIVALTKIDLSTVNQIAAIDAVRQRLRDTPFPTAPIVAVSAITGHGLDQLRSTLVSVLSKTSEQRDICKPRLAVDRAFTLHGIGTVVTGTLMGGTFREGQPVVIEPTGKAARVRSIQSHNQNLPSIGPGTRTALNLADVEVIKHGSASPDGVHRGDVITVAGLGQSVSALDVLLIRSSRLLEDKSPASRALKDGAAVRVHLGTGNWSARLALLDRKEVAAGATCIARLKFESLIFAFVEDRLIIRDSSEQATLAGGIVLANDSTRRSFREPARRLFLERCAASVGDIKARVAAQVTYEGIVRRSELLLRSPASPQEIAAQVSALGVEGKVLELGELVADSHWWNGLCNRAIQAIDAAHQAYPERVGMPLSELRSTLKDALGLPETFEALFKDLLKKGFMQAGTAIKRVSHQPVLPPRLQASGDRLRRALAVKPLEPPSRNELLCDANARQALQFLVEAGEVVELGPENVILQESFSRATQVIKEFLITHRSATVSELRQAVGTTRRVIVPLLEGLDRMGITQRQGDQRILRPISTPTRQNAAKHI